MPCRRTAPPFRPVRQKLALAVCLACAAMLPQAARAQAAQESAAAPRAYDIPPGPLTATLNWFAAETGIFLRGCLQNKLYLPQ